MFMGYICIKLMSMFVNRWKMDLIRTKTKYICVHGHCGVW